MPAQPGPGIISPQPDIKGLVTGYNTALAAMRSDNSTIFQRIAFVPGAATVNMMRSETRAVQQDGRLVNAQFVRFPFPMQGNPPKRWDWGTARQSKPAQVAYVEVELYRNSPDLEEIPYDTLDMDSFNLVSNNLATMLDRAPKVWDYILAQKLAANGTAFTNKPFFSPQAAPHPANPNIPSFGTFYNDITVTALDNANMKVVVDLLEAAPGFDGQPLDTGTETEILFLAPTSIMEMSLKEVFQGSIQAQAVGANAAATGPNNGLQGKAKVLLWKDLRKTAPSGGLDPTKVGYALAMPNNITRPLLVVPKRQPTACYEGMSPNDRSRIETGGVRYGWDCFGGVELTLPQRAVRFYVQ